MAIRKTFSSGPARADSVANALIDDIRRLFAETRAHVATTANATQTLLHGRIGKRIGEEVLNGARADRGQEILAALSQEFAAEFGNRYSDSALTRMGKFVGAVHAGAIVATLRRQLNGRTQFRLSPNATARSLLQRSVLCRVHAM